MFRRSRDNFSTNKHCNNAVTFGLHPHDNPLSRPG